MIEEHRRCSAHELVDDALEWFQRESQCALRRERHTQARAIWRISRGDPSAVDAGHSHIHPDKAAMQSQRVHDDQRPRGRVALSAARTPTKRRPNASRMAISRTASRSTICPPGTFTSVCRGHDGWTDTVRVLSIGTAEIRPSGGAMTRLCESIRSASRSGGMADAAGLNPAAPKGAWGFESLLRHHRAPISAAKAHCAGQRARRGAREGAGRRARSRCRRSPAPPSAGPG